VHSNLTLENARLRKDLEDAQLDLIDATKSRRELQQKVNMANVIVGQSSADVESMKVGLLWLPDRPILNLRRIEILI
jgi:hypothetical protein